MDEKKQIEEMARDIEQRIQYGYYNGRVDYKRTAKSLYLAGYRKQREGEFIYQEYSMGHYVGKCTICGCEADMTKYCPNCGAKMKGGAE